jgi:alginate O-acetyltransferase complex protein AlgI
LLAWFKYAGFLAQTLVDLGWESLTIPSIVLPIGISFFTFQSMSYTFDVAAGRLEPFANPLQLLLYVSLFPQLIAGPIVRARDVAAEIPQRTVGLPNLSNGFERFAWGLAKKVLIADSVAPLVDAAFASEPSMIGAWIAGLGYAVQIYFDFSGYSDMAIGLGMMLGFNFPENFRRPYASSSVTDFWRRWHMTLSSWFRDYLYIPLGGNRRGRGRTYLNLLCVFLVTGLWHGAALTFVAWGLWHGAALMFERSIGVTADSKHWGLRAWTALVVVLGWILFRAESISTASSLIWAAMTPSLDLPTSLSSAMTPVTVGSLLLGLAFSAAPTRFDPRQLLQSSTPQGLAIRLPFYSICLPLIAMRVLSDTFTPFLYFQF